MSIALVRGLLVLLKLRLHLVVLHPQASNGAVGLLKVVLEAPHHLTLALVVLCELDHPVVVVLELLLEVQDLAISFFKQLLSFLNDV